MTNIRLQFEHGKVLNLLPVYDIPFGATVADLLSKLEQPDIYSKEFLITKIINLMMLASVDKETYMIAPHLTMAEAQFGWNDWLKASHRQHEEKHAETLLLQKLFDSSGNKNGKSWVKVTPKDNNPII